MVYILRNKTDDKTLDSNYRLNKNNFKEEIQQTCLASEYWTKMIGKRNEKVECSDKVVDITHQPE